MASTVPTCCHWVASSTRFTFDTSNSVCYVKCAMEQHMSIGQWLLRLTVAALLGMSLAACDSERSSEPQQPVAAISPTTMADALFSIAAAYRNVYANEVVYRLQDVEDVIKASEQWHDEKALPLPAQIFRMGAVLAAKQTDAFSYTLLSKWPLNKDSGPKSEVERKGLDRVIENPTKPFYSNETVGEVEYFTAVYADIAVSPSCVSCHNSHPESPRTDFKQGDVMGGVVIRIPMR